MELRLTACEWLVADPEDRGDGKDGAGEGALGSGCFNAGKREAGRGLISHDACGWTVAVPGVAVL